MQETRAPSGLACCLRGGQLSQRIIGATTGFAGVMSTPGWHRATEVWAVTTHSLLILADGPTMVLVADLTVLVATLLPSGSRFPGLSLS